MAISNEFPGNYKGQIGQLVSYTLNGRKIIRRVGKNNHPPSMAQLIVRQKMALTIYFLKPILDFIRVGFGLAVKDTDQHPHNAATSYNKKHAIEGEYPNQYIDYTKVLVSKGPLEPASDPALKLTGNELEITWTVAKKMDWSLKNDRAMILVYNTELHEAVYLLSGTRRSSGKDLFKLPEKYIGQQLHVYISFISNGGHQISNSTYVP